MTIYERIKYLRESFNMSQQELAEKVGYKDKSAISKVERGDRDINQSMIMKYAAVFGVSPSYILYGNEFENENSPTELTAGERAWIELYRKLSPDTRATMVTLVEKFEDLPDGERQMLLGVIRGALSNRGE